MNNTEMRVVVTGASGYVGRSLVAQLLPKVDAVLCLGQTEPQIRSNNLQFCAANLLQEIPAAQLKAFRPTHLIHLAWIADHGVFWQSPLNTLWVAATSKLIAAFAAAGGTHLTVSGTCAEYSWNEMPCDEASSETEPFTLYGQSKLRCLNEATEICSSLGLQLAWARIFFPYGRQENVNRFIPQVYLALQRQEPLEVCGELKRDLIFVDDAASAILHMALSQLKGVYNVSSGQAVELSEVVKLLARNMSTSHACITFKPLLAGTQPKLLLGHNHKLLNTGWQYQFDLKNGLRQVNQANTSGK